MEWYRCGPRIDAVQCSDRRVRALNGGERRTVAGGGVWRSYQWQE